jgi:hypothetical protein
MWLTLLSGIRLGCCCYSVLMSFCYGFIRYKTDKGQKLEPIEEVTIEVIIQFGVHSMRVHEFGPLTS